MWERGLKLRTEETIIANLMVAPHVGAWIETVLIRMLLRLVSIDSLCLKQKCLLFQLMKKKYLLKSGNDKQVQHNIL